MSDKGRDLRLSVIQTFIQCLLHVDTPEGIREADELVSCVEAELGDKAYILHWRLDLLEKSADANMHVSSRASVIRRMIMIMENTEEVFQVIMHHIRQVFKQNCQLGRALMDEMILTKLLRFQNSQRTGKALLRRMWMATQGDTQGETTEISTLLNKIQDEASVLNGDICGAIHGVSIAEPALMLQLTSLASMEEGTILIWPREP